MCVFKHNYAPHELVNDKAYIRQWSHMIISPSYIVTVLI
jgi:hypothetical protein